MLEKEIKILDIDKEKVIKRLINLWAEKTYEWLVHDIYYDFLEWEKKKMQENDRLFRIRSKWDVYLYTIKRKRVLEEDWWEKWVKVADEWENLITNVESFKNVLEKYWMHKVREKKKFRVSFRLWEVEFDLDEYEWIPPLLEIEAKTKKEINKYIKELKLSKNVQKTFGSRWLFKYYWMDYVNFY